MQRLPAPVTVCTLAAQKIFPERYAVALSEAAAGHTAIDGVHRMLAVKSLPPGNNRPGLVIHFSKLVRREGRLSQFGPYRRGEFIYACKRPDAPVA